MKNKLSPLEELRQERERLLAECSEDKDRLLYKLNYSKSNFGHLLFSSAFSSTKSGISEIFSLVAGDKKSSKKAPSSGFAQIVLGAAPIIWEIMQPMLLGFAIKKVKSVFTRKKKK